VFDLFGQNLKNPRNTRGSTNTGGVISMTMDILVLLLPYLSTQDASELFYAIFSEEVLVNPDNGVQKRGYKILARLVKGGKVSPDAELSIKRLGELSDRLSPAAKKVNPTISHKKECNSHVFIYPQDQLQLYANLLPSIPPSTLHVIPLLIPEAVLGTKEPSEKARGAAFELIIAMGRKMAEGGVVKRNLVDGMDEDGEGVSTFLISLLWLNADVSQGKPGRIRYDDCGWLSWCNAPHDQCNRHRHVETSLRVQRYDDQRGTNQSC
jgi:ribosomal RNA-processing protein 12